MMLELQYLTTGERKRGIGSTYYTPIFYNGVKIGDKRNSLIDGLGEANTISFVYDYREYGKDKSYAWLRWFYQRRLSSWWDYRTVFDLEQAIHCAMNAGLPIVPFCELSPIEQVIVASQKENCLRRDK